MGSIGSERPAGKFTPQLRQRLIFGALRLIDRPEMRQSLPMHELSLACSLVEEAEKVLEAENATRAIRVTVGVGKLSGVELDAFEFAFPMAAKGSRLEEAELVINDLPIRVQCKICEKKSNPDFPRCVCTFCGSDDIELLGGREFNIESMEIE